MCILSRDAASPSSCPYRALAVPCSLPPLSRKIRPLPAALSKEEKRKAFPLHSRWILSAQQRSHSRDFSFSAPSV